MFPFCICPCTLSTKFSVRKTYKNIQMCLHHSVYVELINLKYEHFEWSSIDKYNIENDTCAYIEPDTCKDIACSETDLCILQYNIRGLVNKQKDIQNILATCTTKGYVDIVILSETWLTSESEKRIHVPGYEYLWHSQENQKRGRSWVLN